MKQGQKGHEHANFPYHKGKFKAHCKNVQATAYKEHITACNEKSGEVI